MNLNPVSSSAQSQAQWRNELGQPIPAPTQLRVVHLHRMDGGSVDLWQDQNNRTVNDPSLPAPVRGLTATLVNGAWILGGQTSDGGTPRGLDLGWNTNNP